MPYLSRKTLVLIVVGVLVLPVHPAGAQRNDLGPNPAPFAAYPATPAFRWLIRRHLNPVAALDTQAPLTFFASWFEEESVSGAQQLAIREGGEAYSVQSIYDWSERNSRSLTLTRWDLHRVQQIIPFLKATNIQPTLPRLLVVSFRKEGEWRTYFYDRADLPKEITEIYTLTGAPSPLLKTPVRNDAP
jgi:hypothetical protein